LRQCTGNTASNALGLRAHSRPPGTEFLDAETRCQKSPFKRANARRDRKPGIEWPEVPAKTSNLASSQKRAVCEGWVVETVGLELETHHPVIEPVSAPRRERKFLMQRQAAKRTLLPARDRSWRPVRHAKCPVPAH
jgi:hypothetical protein